FATDRGALFFFILFPFLFITLFSFINIGATEDTKLKLYIVSEEAEGGLSYQIIDALESAGDWEIIVMDYEEAYQAVENKEISGFEAYQAADDKKISGFIAFPADFTEGIMTGAGTELEVVTEAEAMDDRAALYGLSQTIASRVGAQYVIAKATIELLIEQGIIAPDDTAAIEQVIQPILAGQGASGQSFIEYRTEKVGEVKEESNSNWVIPGYLVMFVFFGAAIGAETIVRERQNRTLERLLASSVRQEAILGGIFTGTAAKGLIQILLFWVVGILAFNLDLGPSPAAVIVLSILTVIMSAAFAIMLATLVKTQRSAGSIAVLASLVLAPLGGCWWPLFILPQWMQALAKITPHGWATTGFNKLMLFGADFGAVVPEMLALVGFAVLFSAIAVWRFRTSAVE
ncbi:MAG: ABC transporter permease, partial [Chloroflexi bacterium]|nr:ABC transporter permease [Chloroflexota bacterium]